MDQKQHHNGDNGTRVNFIRHVGDGRLLTIGTRNAFGILAQTGQTNGTRRHYLWLRGGRYGHGLRIGCLRLRGLHHHGHRRSGGHGGLLRTVAGDKDFGFFCQDDDGNDKDKGREDE